MIRRYPCQIGILFVMGVLSAKAAFEKERLLAAAVLAAALFISVLWARKEAVFALAFRRAAMLILSFSLAASRMYTAGAQLKRQLSGLADDAPVVVQGKIVKKQFKETGQKSQWVVDLADCYLKEENSKKENYQEAVSQTTIQQEAIHRTVANQEAIRQKTIQKTEITDQNISKIEKSGFREFPVRGLLCKDFSSEDIPSKESGQIQNSLHALYASDKIRSVGRVIAYIGDEKEPVIGNTVLLSGKIKLFSGARNEGNFDERSYYQNRGYTLKIYASDTPYEVKDAQKNGFLEACYRLQKRLLAVFENAMPQTEAGVIAAMLLGEKSALSEEVKKIYQQSGIAHILAISGIHISILGAFVYRLLRKLGAAYVTATIASVALLFAFGCMTGMGLSAMRAILMFGIYLGAACCGRAYDSRNALAVALVFLLWQNPCALFLSGFQFSFFAIAGVLLGKEICEIVKPKYRLVESLIISLGIQLLTLPLTAWYYFEIPVYSIFLNLLVLPLVEAALLTGLAGGGLALLTGPAGGGLALVAEGFGVVFEIISEGLLGLCAGILKYFFQAAGLFLKLPGSLYAVGKPAIWQMACYYALLFSCVYLIFNEKQKQEAALEPQSQKRSLLRQKRLLYTGILLCACVLCLRLPRRAEVDVLDVGQGDGIYIHTSDGQEVFIDGGSTDVSKVGTYRMLPFLKAKGVSHIDFWFVSHLDKDHISGFEELAEQGFLIKQAVFAKGAPKDEACQMLMAKLSRHNIKTVSLDKGDVLQGKKARFVCLAPKADEIEVNGKETDGPTNRAAKDRNGQSLTLRYEDSGFFAFFSGDISQKEEVSLSKEGGAEHTSFYKAAHHGSKNSNSTQLLKKLTPLVSVVSCAEKNDYGHPGKEAVERMERDSQSVYYTMKGGRIRVSWDKGGVFVEEFCGKQQFGE